jgi:hypothetical protein
MIGVIFTEFLELVENQFGYAMVDRLLSDCQLQSQGVYTSVGSYNYEELMVMVAKLSEITQIAKADLIKLFGRTLFPKLVKAHGNLIENIEDSLDLVSQVDNSIHVEVFKLYPNAELPVFKTRRISQDQLELIYQSKKPLATFAEGMLYGCAEHFGEVFELTRSRDTENCETHACINIVRRPK